MDLHSGESANRQYHVSIRRPAVGPRRSRSRQSNKVSRREFLIGLATSALVVPSTAAPSAGAVPDSRRTVSGTVDQATTWNMIAIYLPSGQSESITLAPDYYCWYHSGPAEATSFQPGDELVAEGATWRGIFIADYVATLFRSVRGTVLYVDLPRLVTTNGSTIVTAESRPWSRPGLVARPLELLTIGDEIEALAWRDPSTGLLVVMQLGVKGERA